jgi:exodeoxyribonuclease-3
MHMSTYIDATMQRFQKFDTTMGVPFREIVGSLLWIVLNIIGPELLRVKDLARRSNDFTVSDYDDALKVLGRIYERRDCGIIYRRGGAGKEYVPSSSRPEGDLTMPATDVEIGFPEMPSFKDVFEARALGATFDGVRLWSLYVPNGRTLEDPHYTYKLEWLDRLAAVASEWVESDEPIALLGDFNIAPLDTDVWDIDDFIGATHVSAPERQAFEAFEQIGYIDSVRERIPTGYTYWDYQQLRFPKNEGMRIDFILGTDAFAERVIDAEIVRDERKGEGPSDHVPVVVTLD